MNGIMCIVISNIYTNAQLNLLGCVSITVRWRKELVFLKYLLYLFRILKSIQAFFNQMARRIVLNISPPAAGGRTLPPKRIVCILKEKNSFTAH